MKDTTIYKRVAILGDELFTSLILASIPHKGNEQAAVLPNICLVRNTWGLLSVAEN